MTTALYPPRSRAAHQHHVATIRATYATHTVAEQMQLLGISRSYTLKLRSRLIRAGAVDPADRVGRAAWTATKIADIQMALENGESLRTIARRCKTTPNAIIQALDARGLSVTAIRQDALWQVRTLNQVAALFGVTHGRVTLWRQKKWLKARPNGSWAARKKTAFAYLLVSDEALLAFLQVREAWPFYDPDAITDPDWREAAQDARANAGGRWVTARDYAESRGYAPSYGAEQIRRGDVALPTQKIGNQWYIWIADTEAQP